MNRLSTFKQAPPEVVTGVCLVNELPQFPADITDPQLSRLPVEAHLPRVAHAVGPDLTASALKFDERVVVGN